MRIVYASTQTHGQFSILYIAPATLITYPHQSCSTVLPKTTTSIWQTKDSQFNHLTLYGRDQIVQLGPVIFWLRFDSFYNKIS